MLAAEEKVETGEEGERTVFSGDGTLFSFDEGGWRERGRGELRVKVGQSGGRLSAEVRAGSLFCRGRQGRGRGSCEPHWAIQAAGRFQSCACASRRLVGTLEGS